MAHVCKYSISFLSMQMKNGVSIRDNYMPVHCHPVAEEQLPLLRLVSRRFRDHSILKAVKLAFIPACGRLLRWRGRYASNHASLAPVP